MCRASRGPALIGELIPFSSQLQISAAYLFQVGSLYFQNVMTHIHSFPRPLKAKARRPQKSFPLPPVACGWPLLRQQTPSSSFVSWLQYAGDVLFVIFLCPTLVDS